MVISSIPNSFTVEFGNSFDIAYQQTDSRLRNAVDSMPGSGERMRDQILSSFEMTDITTRGGDTIYTDIASTLWNIFPSPAEAANKIDEWDEAYLGRVVLPTSPIVREHAAAVARKIDQEIIDATVGTAYRGKNGTTASTYSTTGHRVAVTYRGPLSAATSGLNFYKIALAGTYLDIHEVPDDGQRYLAVTAQQMNDLANDVIQNHSTELSSIRMMPGTKVITNILGFQLIQTQLLAVTAGGVRTCPFWHRSAMQLAIWQDRVTRMDVLPERRHALAIRTTVNVGATRKQDAGVGDIQCDE